MAILSAEDITLLEQQTPETLARWACQLNSWEWPAEIPNPEAEKDWAPGSRRSKLGDWIHKRIGYKAFLREWNRTQMNDEEFEDFWRGTFEGDQAAKERYYAYVRRFTEEMDVTPNFIIEAKPS